MILLIELLCCAFLLLTAMFCFSWILLRRHLPYNGRRWIPWMLYSLAVVVGTWHLIFGLMKLWYTIESAGALLS